MTHTHAPHDAASTYGKVITNKFGGKCSSCRNWVDAGKGAAIKGPSGWAVQHNAGECPPAKVPGAAPAVPELGYYVRRDDAAGIKVVESKRVNEDGTKRRYGLVFTPRPGQRPQWLYVRGAGISVADMRPMSAHDAGMLGLAHGHCINCCAPLGGSTLSAQVSALIGYGETCAANNAWPYPKGVAAQRAYMEEHGR